MIATVENLIASLGVSSETLAILGVGIGAMLIVFGLSGVWAGQDPALRRMAEQGARRSSPASDSAILHHAATEPTGLMKTFIPNNRKQRSEIQRQLAQAGLNGAHALRNYYLVRLCLGVLLPCSLLVLIWVGRSGSLAVPEKLDQVLAGMSQLRILQILSVLVGLGFFGPVYWLRSRVVERKRSIEEGFPNALDLIQISVEAGLSFDAAMIRVGNEIEKTAPAMSQEMLLAQREIQAGRSRDTALLEMAARTGVDEVASFANSVLQSMQFGTSISDMLTTYAKEMRTHRELRAQEKANKLPVQMSAVMASLMLPALLLLALGPVVIRYIRFFSH